jgi:hypothetical protein
MKTLFFLLLKRAYYRRKKRIKMDVISIEAMLSEANIMVQSSQVIFWHIDQFFSRKMVTSEQKRREYFKDNDFKPTCERKLLEDKTAVPYWYKPPDLLVQHQLEHMISEKDLVLVEEVHCTVGGDHGGGKFQMTLKVLFCLSSKANISRLFQIASVKFSKDVTSLLKSTALDPIGESLRVMVEGRQLIVTKSDNNKLTVAFSSSPECNGITQACSVQNTIVVVGDLKFYAQLLGRENMSGSWCMWCDMHPSQWNDNVSITSRETFG